MIDLRIDGGTVVHAEGEPRKESIAVDGGKVVAIGQSAAMREIGAREVLDASGLHVFPGVIDTHFHIGFSSPNLEWSTEPMSAAIGGVTTVLAYFRNPQPYDELLSAFIAQAERDSILDFAVHLGILNDGHLARLPAYVERFGLTSIKMYTTYKSGEMLKFGILGQDDGLLYDVLRAAAKFAGLVVNVHCENHEMAERGRDHWVDPKATELEQLSQMRPALAEVEAIRRVALLARSAGAHLFIPHVSSEAALHAALAEREAGGRISLETCPHYLAADMLSEAGVLAKVNPPVRAASDADALWGAIEAGSVDVVGSDHAATCLADKAGDLRTARAGFPGAAMILPVLANGAASGRIHLNRISKLQATAAALFSLQGKGRIAPGFDADLAFVDMTRRKPVTVALGAGISDYSPYEGQILTGWPVLTMVRGTVVARDGVGTVDPPFGRYLRTMR